MEGALWVGVTERMEESICLLFLTLGKKESEMPQHRLKSPRPITVSERREEKGYNAYIVWGELPRACGLIGVVLKHRVGALVRGGRRRGR